MNYSQRGIKLSFLMVSILFLMLRGCNGEGYPYSSLGVPKPLFSINADSELEEIRKVMEGLQKKLASRLAKNNPKSTMDYFRFHVGYSSNKIEGNTLSKKEVLRLLQFDQVSGTRTLRDYLEVKCHDKAFLAIMELSKKERTFQIGIPFIQTLHKICMPPAIDFSDPVPGKLKLIPNCVIACHPRTGKLYSVDFVPPEEVTEELKAVVKWCNENEGACDMLTFISILHYAVIRVHPFEDTNGRVVRLLVNLFLLRNGYPCFWISPKQRNNYLQTLAFANFEDDLLPLAKFLGKCMISSYRQALKDIKKLEK
eukprot:gene27853-33635_t